MTPHMDPEEEVWNALVAGTRDYLHKSGFNGALVGLSGGIDSALVAAIAVDALGAENVVTVAMPSRYSSQHSTDGTVCISSLTTSASPMDR
ncbi:MAG: hypothetical protein U5Q44_08425 [Dehalococcoidia bacterium]|nr:hypothetical protein [Dehalococcoidia bacterium]